MAYGYVHEEYVVDFSVPAHIKEVMDMLEEFDRNEDLRYYNMEEYLDIQCKNACANGLINEKEWKKLLLRYWSDDCVK